MAKALRTAALVVGAVALVATGVGAAAGAGVFGADAASAGGTLAGISVATISTIGTLASVGAGVLGIAAGLSAKRPTSSLGGDQTRFTANKDQGLPYVMGRTSVSGFIVHRQTHGADNVYQTFFGILSAAGPIDGVEAFKVDGVDVSFGANGAALNADYSGFMWRDIQLGATPEARALQSPMGAVPGWDAGSRLSGYAAYAWTLKYDKKGKVYAAGVPEPTVVARGVRAYDPTRDSTYPGGSGPCRVDDESSWIYTESAALHALTWLIGRRANGKRVMGVGAPISGIDVAAYVEAANVAIANGWKISGVVYSTDRKWDALKAILQAGGAEPCRSGAIISCVVKAPRVSLDTIRASDIVGEASVTGSQRRRERINAVVPRYRSEVHDWEMVPAAVVVVPAYVAEDGGQRTRELEYPLVQDAGQAAQLAAYDIVDAREFGPIVLPLKTRWVGYRPGDCLTIDVPDLNMVGQTAIVLDRSLDPSTGIVTLTLRSETAAKHDFALGRTPNPPPTPSLQVIDPSQLLIPGQSAIWDQVGDPNGTKPSNNADVTWDVLDGERFTLAQRLARIGTEKRPRFDPMFWTCNFPNTMMAGLRADGDVLKLDAVFHQRDHLAGVIWESVDNWDHPTTAFDTNRDYRGCVLTFRLQLSGDVVALDEVDGSVLTIEGRKANGEPHVWYVRIGNAVTSGSATDAQVRLDFDNLPGGFYGNESVYAGDVDRMFISLVPRGYDAGGGRLPEVREGGMILSEMKATGAAASLVCGIGPGGVHEVRMTNGYDDSYNVSPARILRNMRLLGYKEVMNHYVGMSHYFRWGWSDAEDRYVAQDVALPLNTPCALWHADLAARLKAAGIELILSLSYEMLDAFMPRDFRQLDANGEPALTGWDPPSSLFSPCNAAGMDYLKRAARQFCDIAAAAGQRVHFQVGEPWYWVDFRTQVPYFYDPATVSRYTAETGAPPPTIASMTEAMDVADIAFLDWLGDRLAGSILDLVAAVRADHPGMTSYALLYLPQVLNEATPEVRRVNLPTALAWPALDILQLEDYDFVLDNRPDLSATGRALAESRLGYPRSRQQYFGGFALFRDTGQIWRYTSNAMQAAYDYGVFPVFVWAYTQVMRDGYVPRLRMAPALGVADLLDVHLTTTPANGDVLMWRAELGRWVAGKPSLS